MTRTAIRHTLMMALVGAVLHVAGCGCTYGTASDVTVTPATSCLETRQDTSCMSLEFTVTNNCIEPLTFSNDDNTLVVEPGGSQIVYPAAYGDINSTGGSCQTHVVIPALLGQTEVLFEFTYERVNRGLGGC